MFPTYFSRKYKKNYSQLEETLIVNDEVVQIVNQIPRFVKDDNYASAFGEQWKLYRLTQLDSYTKVPITYDRTKRCMGVIQHTPKPEETIASLFKQVKPGGYLVMDHYTYRLSHFTKSTELFRFFLKRMDPIKGLKATEKITNFFSPIHKAFRNFYLLQAILSRISPVHSYYFAFPQLSHEDQYKWALLDTHDSLTDWYKHLRFKSQIVKHLRSIGGKDIYCEYSGQGLDARCKK